jgi:O-antigen ligase
MATRSEPIELRPRAGLALAASAPILAVAVGAALAFDPRIGVAILLAALFVPVIALNLPLAVALWFPLVFLEGVPALNLAGKAGGLLITVAWLATARSWLPSRQEAPQAIRRILLALAALLFWLTVSLLWAADVGAVLGDIWHWYAVILLMLVVATTIRTAAEMRLMLWAFVIGASLAVAEGLASGGLTTSSSALATAGERLGGAQGDPNFLAAGIVPAMVLGLALLVTGRNMLERFALVGLVGMLGVGLLASESRGGLLAAIAAVLAAFVFFRNRRTVIAAFALVLVGMAAVWSSVSPGAWERVTEFDGGGSGRTELWTVAWRMAGDNPVLGVGLNNYPSVSPEYVREPGALSRTDLIVEEAQVVHSVYLQLAAEVGFVGLALFALVAILCLQGAWRAATVFERRREHGPAAMSRGVLVAGIGLLAASVFISNGVDQRLWVLFGLTVALLALANRTPQRRERPQQWQPPQRALAPAGGRLSAAPGTAPRGQAARA